MNIKNKRYSIPEMLGILLMLVGVGLGFLITYYSTHFASTGIRNFIAMYEGEITLAAIKSQFDVVWTPLNRSVGLAKLTNVGVYIYLPGLCVFALARRRRWNKASIEELKSYNTEQPLSPR